MAQKPTSIKLDDRFKKACLTHIRKVEKTRKPNLSGWIKQLMAAELERTK